MDQAQPGEQSPIRTGSIILFMVIVFIVVQIGFHATYIRHFPTFEHFTWLHHVHGALMASWVILLVLQPILIRTNRIATHRLFGKLSYIIAPLIIVSIVLIARLNYYKGIATLSPETVFGRQSITWMQLFQFMLFFGLAIYYRKETAKHMRFMIATGIVMMGPGLNRTINAYFSSLPAGSGVVISLYVKTGLALALLIWDLVKKKNPAPYTIVLLAFLLSDLAFYARDSAIWQGFGKLVIRYLY